MPEPLSPDLVALHTVTIKHDPASHAEDCHDDCTVDVHCPGVTDKCRTWWECNVCRIAMASMDSDDRAKWEDLMYDEDDGAWHGVDHSHIDGMWMTPSEDCLLTSSLDNNADDLVYELPEGVHPVDLDCDEGFVNVIPIPEKWLVENAAHRPESGVDLDQHDRG